MTLIGLTVPDVKVYRTRRRDADTADVSSRGGERLGDQCVDHRPDGLGVAVGRRQLSVVAEVTAVADEPDGDLRAADVDRERAVSHQCLWVLSG